MRVADPPPPFTVNQSNVGRAIDNFFNNGGTLPPAFVPLFGLAGFVVTPVAILLLQGAVKAIGLA